MESRSCFFVSWLICLETSPTGKVKSGIPVMSFGKSCASVDCYTRHRGCYTDPGDIFDHIYIYTDIHILCTHTEFEDYMIFRENSSTSEVFS